MLSSTLRPHRPVSRRRRVCDKRFGVTEVIRDVDQPQLVQHLEGTLLGGAGGGVQLERENRPAAGHLTLGQVVLRVRRQIRVAHPTHRRVPFQELRNPVRRGVAVLNSNRQCLKAFQ